MATPGEGTYAGLSWPEAMVRRVVFDGGSDTDQSGVAALAAVLGVTNTGEVLGNLRAAGATKLGVPAAAEELLSTATSAEQEAALRALAETWEDVGG